MYAVTSANIANSAVLANSTGIWTTGTVNALTISQGTNFVANSLGAFHVGQVNAASLTTTNFTANSGTATHSTQISSPSHITGDGLYVANNSTIFVGNNSISRVLTNTSVFTVGNSTVNATVNSTTFSGVALTANNASYLGGTAAAGFLSTSADANITGVHTHSANIVMNGTSGKIIANGGFGSVNYVLSSNGTGMYWADLTVSAVNTLATYTFTNTHTHGNTTQQANLVMANGYILASTINATSITTTTVTINTTAIASGANSYINATTHFISSNSTMNTVITANQITLNGANVMTTTSTLKVYYANNTQAFP